MNDVREFCVECGRPDSITWDKLKVLKDLGVGRISINPQTMSDESLKLIGRSHTVQQAKDAFSLARQAGFTNINMDMIVGLPGEDIDDVKHTLSEIHALGPDSLTVHSLAVKRASKLGAWIEEHGMETMTNTDETMGIAALGARKLGMNPYYLYRQKNMAGNFENTGYAREGAYGIYNILIMEEIEPIIAMGAGSVTKIIKSFGKPERCDNVKDIDLYKTAGVTPAPVATEPVQAYT